MRRILFVRRIRRWIIGEWVLALTPWRLVSRRLSQLSRLTAVCYVLIHWLVEQFQSQQHQMLLTENTAHCCLVLHSPYHCGTTSVVNGCFPHLLVFFLHYQKVQERTFVDEWHWVFKGQTNQPTVWVQWRIQCTVTSSTKLVLNSDLQKIIAWKLAVVYVWCVHGWVGLYLWKCSGTSCILISGATHLFQLVACHTHTDTHFVMLWSTLRCIK